MLPARVRRCRVRITRLAVGLLLLALGACGSSPLVLNGTIPAPLARKLPLTLGVYYPPELRNYSYREPEDSSGKDPLLVQGGKSQLQLFSTLLPALFTRVVVLDSPEPAAGAGNLDAVLIPTLADFQLGLPRKTHLPVYEVWLNYQLQLTRPDGQPLAQWQLTAYGKAPQDQVSSVEAGMQQAATVALRDLAASFTLGFAEVPEVKAWLQANNRDKP